MGGVPLSMTSRSWKVDTVMKTIRASTTLEEGNRAKSGICL